MVRNEIILGDMSLRMYKLVQYKRNATFKMMTIIITMMRGFSTKKNTAYGEANMNEFAHQSTPENP